MDPNQGNLDKYQSKNPLRRYCISIFQKKISQLLQESDPKKIIDVGCGEGFMTQIACDNTQAEITGIDFSKDAIEIARKMVPSASFETGDIYDLPYADQSFDLVLCNEVLEHLEHPKPALKELHRISKNRLIFSVPHEPYFRLGNFLSGKHLLRFGNPLDHLNHWNLKSFSKLISGSFTIKQVTPSFPWIIVEAER